MSSRGIRRATQKRVSAAKNAVGKVTGNDELSADGMLDEAEGAANEAAGKCGVHQAST